MTTLRSDKVEYDVSVKIDRLKEQHTNVLLQQILPLRFSAISERTPVHAVMILWSH